ncbi:hypothetical protein ACOBQB_09940 [Streptomyces sp. G5(2025)]
MIVAADAPRESDPHRLNVYLRAAGTPFVGRDDIVEHLRDLGQ